MNQNRERERKTNKSRRSFCFLLWLIEK